MSDCLSAEAIRDGLPPSLRGEMATIAIAQCSESTQADALAAAPPAQGCGLFLAERQTAGQGRQGRSWLSAPAGGSLAMSLARRFRGSAAAMSGLSLVTGIAVAEALAIEGLGLKWPNDLVADGRKLGGILVNLRVASNQACDAIIGIGINICLPEDIGIDQPWTDLSRLGHAPARNRLVADLLAKLLPAYSQFEAEGMAPFLPRWRRLDALAGRSVEVHEGARVHEGVFAGITDSGALRLREAGGERVFASGEVSLRPA